jgi:hypothetical protein
VKALRALVALIAALALSALGLVGLATPAQAAVNGTYPSLWCGINLLSFNNLGGLVQYNNWTFTMSLTPANAASGAQVTVSVSSPNGPMNGSPVSIPQDGARVEAVLDVEGAVVRAISPGIAAASASETPVFPDGWTATATFNAPAADGAYDVVLKYLNVNFYKGSNTIALTDSFDQTCALDNSPAELPVTPFDLVLPGTGGSDPGPSPTTSSPAPSPTTSSPAPSPTTSSPAPSPTTSSPAPSPTTSSPAPNPSATPVTVTGLKCEIFSGAAGTVTRWEQASPNSSAQDSASPQMAFSATDLTVAAGDEVSLALSYSQGPQSGPIPLDAGITWPKATVTVGGAATGSVTLIGPKNPAIPAYGWIPGTTLTAVWTATTSGTVSFTLDEIAFDYGDVEAETEFTYPDTVEDLDTVCNKGPKPKEDPATIGLVAQEGGEPIPTLPPTVPASDGDVTVAGDLVAGGEIVMSGGGFKPSSNAVAGVYSEPLQLGLATASSSGDVSATVTLPADLVGQHTLVLYGVDAAGDAYALTRTVTITADDGSGGGGGDGDGDGTGDGSGDDSGGTLPQTGPEDFAMTLLWGLVALQIGLVIAVRAARTRRRPAPARHRR